AVGNKPVCFAKRTRAPHRGHSGVPSQTVDAHHVGNDEGVLANVEGLGLAAQRFNRRSKIVGGSNIKGVNANPELASSRIGRGGVMRWAGIPSISQYRQSRETRNDLTKERNSLGDHFT